MGSPKGEYLEDNGSRYLTGQMPFVLPNQQYHSQEPKTKLDLIASGQSNLTKRPHRHRI